MKNFRKYLAMSIILLGTASIVLGAVFIVVAFQKEAWIKDAARMEQITLGLTQEQIQSGEVVDSVSEMQLAADTIREHRRGIAPTYNDLLAQSGGQFDPTNSEDLDYAQALNMENYLYLGVLGYGVTLLTKGIGVSFLIVGMALALTGRLLY
jgi:hypothetical protein